HRIGQLPEQIGPTVLIDSDVPDIGEPDARFAHAVGDRLRREAGPMLDAAESLFLCCRNERAVANNRRSRIAVEGIDSKNDHRSGPYLRPASFPPVLMSFDPRLSALAQPSIDYLQSNQSFRENALKDIIQAGPALEYTA